MSSEVRHPFCKSIFADVSGTGREEMQALFDPHINSMLKKIRDQLDFVQLKAFGNPQVVSIATPWRSYCHLLTDVLSDI